MSKADGTVEPKAITSEQPEVELSNDLGLKRLDIAKWRLITILVSIGVGLFLSLMDTTVVATMLPSVSDEFGGFNLAPWVLLSYTLSYLGFTVLIARLSDVLGRKPVLVASFVIFLAASMACGACSNINQLIGFRAAQGVGGAGLYAMAMIAYPEISPPKLMPMLSAILGLIVALAGVSGPIVGGLLATYVNWRWAFWINGPIGILPAIALWFAWPRNFHTFTPMRFRHLDFLGGLLLMVATVLLVFIVNQATTREYAWDSPQTIAVLVLSGLAWVVLVWWQWYLSRTPGLAQIQAQVPWRLLSHRVLMSSLMSTILTGFVMYVAIVNIPMRAQIANLYDEVKSGILLLPLMGATAVGSGLGGALSSKQNHTFWTLIAASSLMLVGCGLMSVLPGTISVAARQWGFEVVLGFGIGMNLSTTTLLASLNAEFQDFAIVQGFLAQLRVLGGSLGIAASFIILNTHITSSLAAILTPAELAAFYRSPIVTYTFDLAKQIRVRETYIESFTVDMYMCMGISAACLLASAGTYQRDPPSIEKRLGELEALYAMGRGGGENEETGSA